jgi:hypothetical protein
MVLESNTHFRHYRTLSFGPLVRIVLAVYLFTKQEHPRTFEKLNFSVSHWTKFKCCVRSPYYAIKLIWKHLLQDALIVYFIFE